MNTQHARRSAVGRSLLGAALVLLAFAAWLLLRDRDPDRLAAQASAAIDQGRIDRADRLVDRLAKLREPTPDDQFLRTRLAFAQDRIDDALEAIEQIPDDHPMAAWARYRAGQVEVRRHRLRAAEAHFLKALEIDPDRVEVRRELLYVYGIHQRTDEIEEQFRALDELIPLTFHDVWYWCIARDQLRWIVDENQEELTKILKADPEDPWALLAMADVFLNRGATPERIAELLEPLGDDPDAIALRARMELDRGNIPEAERLVARGPAEHAALARLRGALAMKRGGPEAALPHYRKAYELDPDRRETVVGLGQVLRSTGRVDEARPLLERARSLDVLSGLLARAVTPSGRDDPEMMTKIGEACVEAGRLREAIAWFEVVLAADPFDEVAQARLAQLEASLDAEAEPSIESASE